MKQYNVGAEDLDGFPNDLVWVVYSYESSCYEGYGDAVGMRQDGMLICCSLDHCSCYGVLDDWDNPSNLVSQEAFIASAGDASSGIVRIEAVEAKVLELLGVE